MIPLFGYRKHSALLGPVRASDFLLTKSQIAEAWNGFLKHNWRFFMENSESFTDVPGCLGWSGEMEYYLYDIVGESLFNWRLPEPCNSGSIIYSCL